VSLRLGGARPDRIPADQVGEILGRERIERFGARRQAHARELEQQRARAHHALIDPERIVHVRIVDEAFPAGGGARLFEVHAHHQDQRVLHFPRKRLKAVRVLQRRLRIVDRAGTDHNEQAMVAPVQDVAQRGATGQHGSRRPRVDRQSALHRVGRGHLVHAENVDIFDPAVFGRVFGRLGSVHGPGSAM